MSEHQPAPHHTILIIEDDSDIAEVLKISFKKSGPTLHIATNSEEALEWLQSNKPDIIISGIGLPGLNGDEIIERIHSDDRLKNVPFLIFTATPNDLNGSPIRGYDNFLGVFTKPQDIMKAPQAAIKYLQDSQTNSPQSSDQLPQEPEL